MSLITKLGAEFYLSRIVCVDGAIYYHENESGVFVGGKSVSMHSDKLREFLRDASIPDAVKIKIHELLDSGKSGNDTLNAVNVASVAGVEGVVSVGVVGGVGGGNDGQQSSPNSQYNVMVSGGLQPFKVLNGEMSSTQAQSNSEF